MDLLDQDAGTQLRALSTRDISGPELMAATLDRIETRNGCNAIVSLRDRDALMEEAAAPRPGPLSGLPMAVKDLAETAGIRTTFGHPHFADYVPSQDSPMVARLKDAGAIIIGKTNTPEFGLGSHSYNPVHGVTRNPWDKSRSAGGSSGGAGAALAARMVALADGSDMMGSLRNPAAWANVYGMRPSYGLVPNAPVGDVFLHQMSTDGPMARTPDDLELLLSVMARTDAAHPHSRSGYIPADRRSLKIGWTGDWGGHLPLETAVLGLCEGALQTLSDLGHDMIEIDPPFDADALWQSWTTLRSWSIAEKLRPLWTDAFAAQSKPELVWEVERGLSLSAAEVHAASVTRSRWFATVQMLDVDMLAMPATQLMPFDADLDWPREVAGRTMDTYHRWMECVIPASLAGLPAASVPAGFDDGLPGGLQVVGKFGADADLIALMKDYHRVAPHALRSPLED